MAATASPPAKQGRYIVFEGPPGVGKALQIELLAKQLRAAGYPVKVFTATNGEASEPAIISARSEGYICLVKGSPLTAFIQQYYGTGSSSSYEQLSSKFGASPADIVVVFDATAPILLDRLNKHEGGSPYDLAYLERIRAGYLWEAKQRGYPVIYTGASPEAIHTEVWRLLVGRQPAMPAPVATEPTPISSVISKRARNLQPKQTAATESEPRRVPAQLKLQNLSYWAASEARLRFGGQVVTITPSEATKPRYHKPAKLPKKLATTYEKQMEHILDNYTQIVEGLTTHIAGTSPLNDSKQKSDVLAAARAQALQEAAAVLPLAAHANISITLNHPEQVGHYLMQADLAELKAVGEQLPPMFEYSKTGSESTEAYAELRAIADKSLPQVGDLDEDIRLVSFAPRNELALVPNTLYAHTSLSLLRLQNEVDQWSYEQKAAALLAYARLPEGLMSENADALLQATYTWDIVDEFATMLHAQALLPRGHIVHQPPTPRYGFDTPETIETANLEELYEQCFDLSAELYSNLQAAGLTSIAPYATLLGHRLRWQLHHTARDLVPLFQAANQEFLPGRRRLYKQLVERLSEIHPILSDAAFARLNIK